MKEIIGLSLLAGIFELDVTAFAQVMLSRPIFCGPVFGYILGDIISGFWIGIIAELIWIDAIPMGTSIPMDVTIVTILSSIWGIKFLNNEKSGIIFSIALALPLGFLFRYFDIKARYFNSRIVRWIEEGIKTGKEGRINLGIYFGIVIFFMKAFIFYLVFALLGKFLLKDIFNSLPREIKPALEISWYFLPVVGFGKVLVDVFKGKLGCFR